MCNDRIQHQAYPIRAPPYRSGKRFGRPRAISGFGHLSDLARCRLSGRHRGVSGKSQRRPQSDVNHPIRTLVIPRRAALDAIHQPSSLSSFGGDRVHFLPYHPSQSGRLETLHKARSRVVHAAARLHHASRLWGSLAPLRVRAAGAYAAGRRAHLIC